MTTDTGPQEAPPTTTDQREDLIEFLSFLRTETLNSDRQVEVDGDTGEAGASRVPIYFVIFLQWTTEAAPTEAPAAAEQLSAAQVEMRGKTERKVTSRGTSAAHCAMGD